jgi:two-component system, sensor histidine kinase and response regulator
MIDRIFDRWFGDASIALPKRLFHVFSLMAALGALGLFVIDSIQGTDSYFSLTTLDLIALCIYSVFYFISFRLDKFERILAPAYIATYGVILAVWYLTGGVTEVVGITFAFFTYFFVFIAPNHLKVAFVVFNISLYFLLTLIEIKYPLLTVQVIQGDALLLRSAATTAFIIMGMMIGIIAIHGSFKYHQDQAEQDRIKLKALSDIQTQMISIISHDVRAPFGNIHHLLGMVKNGMVSPEQTPKIMGQIMKSVMSSREVLESMVGWTRAQIQQINDGDLEASFTTPAVPAEIIENNIGDWRDIAADKNVEIQYQICCAPNTRIIADNNLLRTVLRNIILNGVKYTPPNGTVQLTVMKVNQHVVITVVDNGIGMSPERMAQLFKGKLNSNKGTDNERGSGIGLWIVNDMLQRVESQIEVKSELGKGSVFTITFAEYIPEPND